MNRLIPVFILVFLAVIIADSSLYVVKETERAVKLRFGRLIDTDIKPGLHIKMPLADDIRKFDARVMTLDAQPESFLTVQKKRLIVDSFAKWRIADVDTYYKATGGNEAQAMNRLAKRVNDGLRNEFGTRTLNEVVSGERDILMKDIKDGLNERVKESLGVEVVDVRVKRIDLPPEVSDAVFRRMQAEREKEARELRSEGLEEAEKIRSSAEREKTIIEATAYSEAELLRGEGDAQAAATYAAAYSKDPEFYAFVRSLNAYRSSFKDKGDIMLVDPQSDFFKYLNDSKAGR
ncbi:MAG: protease modulator HflC [Oceanicoccus sp.]|uniref:protease modulator HflC n=1 Tax=Oceanicoccus sp. TaxID=2691044 RepID=UPI00261901E8|nr:protease modulator HflC [Oceanicoccus sp.]MCP3906509.1 protease modulator HflC [Oceanicoccus sp.]MDG1772289.1 protease modulator HflC [Oceanicoccus sp.]